MANDNINISSQLSRSAKTLGGLKIGGGQALTEGNMIMIDQSRHHNSKHDTKLLFKRIKLESTHVDFNIHTFSPFSLLTQNTYLQNIADRKYICKMGNPFVGFNFFKSQDF